MGMHLGVTKNVEVRTSHQIVWQHDCAYDIARISVDKYFNQSSDSLTRDELLNLSFSLYDPNNDDENYESIRQYLNDFECSSRELSKKWILYLFDLGYEFYIC